MRKMTRKSIDDGDNDSEGSFTQWTPIENDLPRPLNEVLVAIPVNLPNSANGYLRDIAFVRADGRWFRCYPCGDEQEIFPSYWARLLSEPRILESSGYESGSHKGSLARIN